MLEMGRFFLLILCVLSFESICGRTLRVYLVGDSTCAAKELAGQNPERGWGQLFQPLFDGSVRVENHATNGRSTKSFRDEGRWAAVYDKLQPGDYVFIQFGHNDQKQNDSTRYAAPERYAGNLRRYVRETREKGAIPVLLTPIVRRRFADGLLDDTHGPYADAVRRVAAAEGTQLIDAERLTRAWVSSLGEEASRAYYMWVEPGTSPRWPDGRRDDTHLNVRGARAVARMIAAQLQAIVGAKRFFAGDAVKDDFSHDEMPIYGKYYPEVVCEAESTEEVSAILRVCYDNNIPVTPRGAGTGLVGGCVPLCGGVVLCTTRMNKILSYDMNNLVVHIQPGVLLCDLAADALTHGLMYPPDPGEKTATVGGNVSTNAGGMRAVKYGVTRDYVLAMTVVLPDGRVMELGKTVCKTSSGYSLLHLMIGSEGTLGVITELTLKLIPKPEMNVSLILPFADVETAIASVPKIKLANLDPQSIEFMERDIVDSSAAFTGNTIFPTVVDGKEAGAYILVTLVGDSEAELTAKMDRLGALAEQCGAYDTLVVWTDGLKKDVWAARSAFLTVIEADTKLLDEMDVVVPVDRIAEFLVYTRATGKAEGITIRNFGHAGDGNLHIYCCANDMALDEFKRRSKAVMDKCYAKCIEFGGQVSGEHAIGHAKKQYLVESAGETAFGLMQAIKQVFDPKGILNPGKVCTNVEEG